MINRDTKKAAFLLSMMIGSQLIASKALNATAVSSASPVVDGKNGSGKPTATVENTDIVIALKKIEDSPFKLLFTNIADKISKLDQNIQDEAIVDLFLPEILKDDNGETIKDTDNLKTSAKRKEKWQKLWDSKYKKIKLGDVKDKMNDEKKLFEKDGKFFNVIKDKVAKLIDISTVNVDNIIIEKKFADFATNEILDKDITDGKKLYDMLIDTKYTDDLKNDLNKNNYSNLIIKTIDDIYVETEVLNSDKTLEPSQRMMRLILIKTGVVDCLVEEMNKKMEEQNMNLQKLDDNATERETSANNINALTIELSNEYDAFVSKGKVTADNDYISVVSEIDQIIPNGTKFQNISTDDLDKIKLVSFDKVKDIALTTIITRFFNKAKELVTERNKFMDLVEEVKQIMIPHNGKFLPDIRNLIGAANITLITDMIMNGHENTKRLEEAEKENEPKELEVEIESINSEIFENTKAIDINKYEALKKVIIQAFKNQIKAIANNKDASNYEDLNNEEETKLDLMIDYNNAFIFKDYLFEKMIEKDMTEKKMIVDGDNIKSKEYNGNIEDLMNDNKLNKKIVDYVLKNKEIEEKKLLLNNVDKLTTSLTKQVIDTARKKEMKEFNEDIKAFIGAKDSLNRMNEEINKLTNDGEVKEKYISLLLNWAFAKYFKTNELTDDDIGELSTQILRTHSKIINEAASSSNTVVLELKALAIKTTSLIEKIFGITEENRNEIIKDNELLKQLITLQKKDNKDVGMVKRGLEKAIGTFDEINTEEKGIYKVYDDEKVFKESTDKTSQLPRDVDTTKQGAKGAVVGQIKEQHQKKDDENKGKNDKLESKDPIAKATVLQDDESEWDVVAIEYNGKDSKEDDKGRRQKVLDKLKKKEQLEEEDKLYIQNQKEQYIKNRQKELEDTRNKLKQQNKKESKENTEMFEKAMAKDVKVKELEEAMREATKILEGGDPSTRKEDELKDKNKNKPNDAKSLLQNELKPGNNNNNANPEAEESKLERRKNLLLIDANMIRGMNVDQLNQYETAMKEENIGIEKEQRLAIDETREKIKNESLGKVQAPTTTTGSSATASQSTGGKKKSGQKRRRNRSNKRSNSRKRKGSKSKNRKRSKSRKKKA